MCAAAEPDPGAKGQGYQNVEAIEQQALLGFDLVFIAVQDAEIEDKQTNDDRDERDPEICGSTEKIARKGGKKRFHRRTFSM
ncbi:hypothetical protein D3C87_2044740 [compost metagenome]